MRGPPTGRVAAEGRGRDRLSTAPGPTSRSSRPGSTGGPTTGPTTRPSTCWSTSARWRTSPRTPSPASPTTCSRCCPAWSTTPAGSGAGAGSWSGCARAPGWGTWPSTSPSSSSGRPGGEQRRGKTRGARRRGQYNVIYGYGDDQVGLAAGRLAVRLVNHLVEREPGFDFEAELERFILRAERTAFGPSTQAILDEAAARDIPWLRLNEYSLVQLGQGIYQQRIRATMTSKTELAGGRRGRRQGADDPAAGRRRPARAPLLPGAGRSRTRWPRPGASGSRWWSSRWTATTAAASTSTCAARRRWRPPSRPPRPRPGGARSWSRPLSPATTTGCWWWAGGWWRSPSGSRPTWSATAPTPWPSWSSRPTPTPAAASATRRS